MAGGHISHKSITGMLMLYYADVNSMILNSIDNDIQICYIIMISNTHWERELDKYQIFIKKHVNTHARVILVPQSLQIPSFSELIFHMDLRNTPMRVFHENHSKFDPCTLFKKLL